MFIHQPIISNVFKPCGGNKRESIWNIRSFYGADSSQLGPLLSLAINEGFAVKHLKYLLSSHRPSSNPTQMLAAFPLWGAASASSVGEASGTYSRQRTAEPTCKLFTALGTGLLSEKISIWPWEASSPPAATCRENGGCLEMISFWGALVTKEKRFGADCFVCFSPPWHFWFLEMQLNSRNTQNKSNIVLHS